MTRPALRAAGALLFLSSLSALAAPPSQPAVKPAPAAPKPAPTPAAVALSTAFKEITADQAKGSYARWLETLPGFRYTPATSALLVKEFGNDRLFTVKRNAPAGGIRDFSLTVPALRHANQDGSSFSWATVQGNFTVQPDGRTVTHQFSAPNVVVEDKVMRMEMRAMTMHGTGQDSDTGVQFGEGIFAIDTVQMMLKADGSRASLDGLSVKYAITDQGATESMRIETAVRTAAAADQRFDDLHLAVRFDGLDKAAMAKIGKMGAQLPDEQDRKARQQAIAVALRQLVIAITAKGAAITLEDLSFSYRGNTARMQGDLHLENVVPADLDQPLALMKKVVGHTDVQVPVAMARAYAESMARKQLATQQPGADAAAIARLGGVIYDGVVNSALANGYVRIEGGMLVTSIDVRDGVVLINGKPLPARQPGPPAAAVNSGAGIMRARRIAEKCVLPDYPADVVAEDRALSIALQLTVNPDGSVTRLSLARSSGVPAYDAAVLAAAASCTYIPALRNGKPVAVSEVWEVVRAPGSARP